MTAKQWGDDTDRWKR